MKHHGHPSMVIYKSNTHEVESTVTVPEGSATSKMPDSASRIERTNSCVPAVRLAEGGIGGIEYWGRVGVKRSIFTCILAEKSAEKSLLVDARASSANVWWSLLPRGAVARGSGSGA